MSFGTVAGTAASVAAMVLIAVATLSVLRVLFRSERNAEDDQ